MQKLRQIADTIHQTVYLSEMESNLMSTAYFYRLHDVYQCSTVYLTFPCNRTKRYEHSYGTMDLAGEMFFSAVTNASENVLKKFFYTAELYLRDVVEKLISARIKPTYCSSAEQLLANCFIPVKPREVRKKSGEFIDNVFLQYDVIEDTALSHYIPPFKTDLQKNRFLYQCLLEAIRIVALFHDVGHPPYSHIMEAVLSELYNNCKNNPDLFDCSKVEEFLENLTPFKEGLNDNLICLISTQNEKQPALHEQIGIKMLASAFEDFFLREFKRNDSKPIDKKSTIAIYYIAVVEFCFAILREQSSFFISLHRIIDGCIDADRMDYIVRDSQNSGVGWGTIPYKRLIDSCKLIRREYDNKVFYQIAFQKKMAEHIDDILLTRYKIFSRINYHHRSYKTALILQRIVKILSEDYLKKNANENVLCPGIDDLWNCLANTLNSHDLYIIQWNDSTLISHLYHALAEIKAHNAAYYSITLDEYSIINNMLDEFLLNHKHYYSVFKRQSDFYTIFSGVFKSLRNEFNEVNLYEIKKLQESRTTDSVEDALESIKRLTPNKLEGVIHNGDAEVIEKLFPPFCSLKDIIPQVLQQYQDEGKIGVFLFDVNEQRTKTGLPKNEDKSDAIYLYESDSDDFYIYDTTSLISQLASLQGNCLQYIAYVEMESENEETIDEIRRTIGERFLLEVKKSMEDIFSCLREDKC